jgi:hypothetical protein
MDRTRRNGFVAREGGMRWFSRWLNRRRRSIDMQILWPICVENAGDLDTAKAAFRLHTSMDHAWADLRDVEIDVFVDSLTPHSVRAP